MTLQKVFIQILGSGILVVLMVVTGCDSSRVYEEYSAIRNETWTIDQSLLFSPDVNDTSSIHNIYVNVRNTNAYNFSNLFLFIKTTSPTGEFIQDTLEIRLADEHGRWLGRGVASVFFNRTLYKQNVRFPSMGMYAFEIRHGMRIQELEGIRDVGLRIETVTP